MKPKILKVGDLVEMKEGMAAKYAHFENIYYQAGEIDGHSDTIVYIGRVYQGRGDGWASRLRLRNAIIELFKQENRTVDNDILRRFLEHQVKDTELRRFVIPAGLYEITEIVLSGVERVIHCKTYKVTDDHPMFTFRFFQGRPTRGAMNHDKIEPVRIFNG